MGRQIPADPKQTVQPDASSGASPDQTASTTSAAQPDGRPASGAQTAAVRSASSQPNSQPATEPGAAAPVLASHASIRLSKCQRRYARFGSSVQHGADCGKLRLSQGRRRKSSPSISRAAKRAQSARWRKRARHLAAASPDKDQGSVQVRLSERAGELHVSVRTPDAGLTRGLARRPFRPGGPPGAQRISGRNVAAGR